MKYDVNHFDLCLISLSLCAEEEISAMQQELDKYGIQMPAFSKIGGILANEVFCCYSAPTLTVQNKFASFHMKSTFLGSF